MKNKYISIGILVVICLVFGVRAYNGYRFHVEKQMRVLMDTYITIQAVGPKQKARKVINLAFERMKQLDEKFNANNPKSPVYAFNHDGVPISDEEILKVTRAGLEVSRLSDGAFDMTVFPLTQLWGFNTTAPHLPEDDKIKETIGFVGYQHLFEKDGKLYKDDPRVALDFGGIAKGYAIGEAVRVLKENGVTSAVVIGGGSVYALGKKGRELWKVGIKDPRAEGLLGYLEVEDLAVESSGDYERFFMKDGKRYHHIFDPKTGYPAQGIVSVTILHTDPTLADAWSKVIFVLGKGKGEKIALSVPGMDFIITTSSGEQICSPRLQEILVTIPKKAMVQ